MATRARHGKVPRCGCVGLSAALPGGWRRRGWEEWHLCPHGEIGVEAIVTVTAIDCLDGLGIEDEEGGRITCEQPPLVSSGISDEHRRGVGGVGWWGKNW